MEAFNQEDNQQDWNLILYNEWRYLMENELRPAWPGRGGCSPWGVQCLSLDESYTMLHIPHVHGDCLKLNCKLHALVSIVLTFQAKAFPLPHQIPSHQVWMHPTILHHACYVWSSSQYVHTLLRLAHVPVFTESWLSRSCLELAGLLFLIKLARSNTSCLRATSRPRTAHLPCLPVRLMALFTTSPYVVLSQI